VIHWTHLLLLLVVHGRREGCSQVVDDVVGCPLMQWVVMVTEWARRMDLCRGHLSRSDICASYGSGWGRSDDQTRNLTHSIMDSKQTEPRYCSIVIKRRCVKKKCTWNAFLNLSVSKDPHTSSPSNVRYHNRQPTRHTVPFGSITRMKQVWMRYA
jgi:hypothetical protein